MTNPSSTSTKRAAAFRDRLAGQGIKRWEIFASEQTRADVRKIAKAENISAGIAADALLSLGIEAYHASAASAAESDTTSHVTEMSPEAFAQLQRELLSPAQAAPYRSGLAAELGIRSFAAPSASLAFASAAAEAVPSEPTLVMNVAREVPPAFSTVSGSLAAYSSRSPSMSASSASLPAKSSAASVLAAADLNHLLKKGSPQ